MDKVINKLIEVDIQSRQIVADAKKRYDEMMSAIEQETAEYKRELIAKSDKRIDDSIKAEETMLNERIEEIKSESSKVTDEIEHLYIDNHEKWENEIYNKCIF